MATAAARFVVVAAVVVVVVIVGGRGAGQPLDDVLGLRRERQAGVAGHVVLGGVAGGLHDELDAAHGKLLARDVGRQLGVGALRALAGGDLGTRGERQAVGLDGSLEDAQVVYLHGVALQDELLHARHHVGQDADDEAGREGRVVLVHVLGQLLQVVLLLGLHAGVVLAVGVVPVGLEVGIGVQIQIQFNHNFSFVFF